MNINTIIIYEFILLGILILLTKSEFIEVETNEGKVLGKTFLTAYEDQECYAFQGIPYAEPPVRFELPVQKNPWKGTIDCTYDKPSCVQGSFQVIGSEDCLTLSVYSTNLSGNTEVFLWIHAGGFSDGDGSYERYGVDFFVNRGLVVVLIQYRLGIFGYISTGDLTCPGNNGMKDQVMAFDWVKRNIHFFGGNPNKITIGGTDAGGASVGYHLLSPLSHGKFNGAILSSGVSECLSSLNRNAVRIAYETGKSFGIYTDKSAVLISGLKNIDYEKLQTNSNNIASAIALENVLIGLQFGVVSEVPHNGSFFTGNADEMFRTGNFYSVPILAGFTTNEMGAVADPSQLAQFNVATSNLDRRPYNMAPASLSTNRCVRKTASYCIKYKFFGSEYAPITPCIAESIKFFNVDQFVRPIDRFIKNVGQFQPRTYFYIFSYEGILGGVKNRYLPGAQHAEDQGYLWKRPNEIASVKDIKMREMMVLLTTNFIKYKEPIPQPNLDFPNIQWWPALDKNAPFLMNITYNLARTDNPFEDYVKFYQEKIFDRFGEGNYNTY